MADQGDRERMTRIGEHLVHAGVTVRWIDGWETRGATWPRVPVGLIDHHEGSELLDDAVILCLDWTGPAA